MHYKHTQDWKITNFIVFFISIYLLIIYSYTQELNIIYNAIPILVIIYLWFYKLIVEVTNSHIKIKYGVWIIKKSFLLSKVKSVKKVKNKWYYGWWIRIWFWPKMWIYNISWFDAVELVIDGNKIVRIWTDDQDNLETEIKNKIK
jgi:hypothetical protein